jgi:DNA polymerase I-like protein with 3'-5' exonuclease and polymerase domains
MSYLDPNEVAFELVTNKKRAKKILKSFTPEGKYAIDFETTALHPRDGEVRITTIWNDEEAYVFDHFECGSFESLVKLMTKHATFICFHIVFEGLWFDWFVPDRVKLWDVAIMRKSVQGGGGYSLAMMAKWDLKVTMNKSEQASDWSAETLTPSQYTYAAYDGYVTWELFKMWRDKMTEGHWNGFHIINSAWRANIEMQGTALFLDVNYHQKNIDIWRLKRDTAQRYFERYTPKSTIPNIASNKQMSNFLKAELNPEVIANWPTTPKSGDLQLERQIVTAAARRLPAPMNRWLAAFIVVRYYSKYLSTYGDTMVNSQNLQGKLSTKFNMAQAITCRYSSSAHNLQNIPRKPYIRKAFTVRPDRYEHMVLADYSGVEVRVIAEIAQDKQLLRDTVYGNVHASGAAIAQKIDEGYFLDVLNDKNDPKSALFKNYRQHAKIGTFRLIYGAGTSAVADSMNMGDKEAAEFVDGWAEKYKRAYNYRFDIMSDMTRTGYIKVCDGRTIYVRKADRQLPIAANYPVQAGAASVMYAAVRRVRDLFVERDLDANVAACVHDEIITYAHKTHSDDALECLELGMEQGWLDVFPNTSVDNLVESAIGFNWAAKP